MPLKLVLMIKNVLKFILLATVTIYSINGYAQSTNSFNEIEFLLSDLNTSTAPFNQLPVDYNTTYYTTNYNLKIELFDTSQSTPIFNETVPAYRTLYGLSKMTIYSDQDLTNEAGSIYLNFNFTNAYAPGITNGTYYVNGGDDDNDGDDDEFPVQVENEVVVSPPFAVPATPTPSIENNSVVVSVTDTDGVTENTQYILTLTLLDGDAVISGPIDIKTFSTPLAPFINELASVYTSIAKFNEGGDFIEFGAVTNKELQAVNTDNGDRKTDITFALKYDDGSFYKGNSYTATIQLLTNDNDVTSSTLTGTLSKVSSQEYSGAPSYFLFDDLKISTPGAYKLKATVNVDGTNFSVVTDEFTVVKNPEDFKNVAGYRIKQGASVVAGNSVTIELEPIDANGNLLDPNGDPTLIGYLEETSIFSLRLNNQELVKPSGSKEYPNTPQPTRNSSGGYNIPIEVGSYLAESGPYSFGLLFDVSGPIIPMGTHPLLTGTFSVILPPSAFKSSIAVSKTTIGADGLDYAEIILNLKTDDGSPYISSSAPTIVFNILSGTATVSQITDNGYGTHSATISSTTLGNVEINATIDGDSVKNQSSTAQSISLAFVPGNLSVSESTIVTSQNIIRPHADSFTYITTTLKDAAGNLLTDATASNHDITFLTDLGTLQTPQDIGNAQTAVKLKPGETPGIATVSAFADGNLIGNVSITVTGSKGLSLDSALSDITAGEIFDLSIKLIDGLGNTIDSSDGTISLSLNDNSDPALKLLGTTSLNITNGLANFTGLSITKASQGVKLKITSSESEYIPALSNSFSIAPASFDISKTKISFGERTVDSNNASSIPVTLKLFDVNGNAITDNSLISTTINVSNGTTISTTQKNSDGTFSAIITNSALSATISISANINGDNSLTPVIYNLKGVEICNGSSTILTSTYYGFEYEWYKDNLLLEGETARTLNVTSEGVYYVKTTNPNTCTSIVEDYILVSLADNTPPTISSDDDLTSFYATDADGPIINPITISSSITGADYRWYKDGVLIDGENSATLQVIESGSYQSDYLIGTNCYSEKSNTLIISFLPLPEIIGPDYFTANNNFKLLTNNLPSDTNPWQIDDSSKVSVSDEGEIIIVSQDEENSYSVVVTFTDENQKTATKTLTYAPEPVITSTGFSFENPSDSNFLIFKTLEVCSSENTIQFSGSGNPFKNENQEVEAWFTSDDSILSIDQTGLATVKNSGLVQLNYINEYSLIATVEIKIQSPEIIGGDRNTDNEILLQIGEEVVLTSTSDILSWASSDSSVADIDDDGRITTSSGGDTTITLTSSLGCSSSIVLNVLDTLAPTVLSIVTDDIDDKVKDTDIVRVTTTFSEVMSASPTISVDLPNGTGISSASMTQSTTADVWYYDWTVTDGGDGIATITVAGSDLAGNAYAGSDTVTVTIDNTDPTLAITTSDSSLITFTFSEDVLGFTDGDITLTGGGTLSSITATSSQVYTATYAPPTDTADTVTITVGTSKYSDVVLNDNTTTSTISFTVDTQSPTLSSVSISSNNSDTSKAKIGDIVTLSFTSSEAIQSPTVTIDGNAATVSGGGTSWTATYTLVSGDTQSALGFTIDFDDLAGNSGTQVTAVTDSSVVTFDETVPTVVSIVTDDIDDKVKDTDIVRVTTTFSEVMSASPTISVDLPNGTGISSASMTQSTTADVWYYDWTVTDGGDGIATITVAGSDLAGNAYAGSDTVTVTIDNTDPTLAITTSDSSLITFTFSEDVLGFTDGDITLTGGGTLSSITATSSQVYTATYAPPTDTADTVTITVGTSKYSDVVLNDNTITSTLSFTVYDTLAPETSALEWSNVANLTLTISFSEAVYATNSGTGSLTTSDFTASVTGGGYSAVSISQVTQLTSNSYSIVLTATGTGAGNEIFEILPAANSIFDSFGNAMSTSQTVKDIQFNSKPIFSDTSSITITVDEGGTVTVPLSGRLNATDSDGPNNTLVYNINDMPLVGSLTASQTLSGDISYTHDGSEVKSDTFNFVAYDGASNSDPIDVNVVINNVNDLPSVGNITNTVTVDEDILTNIDLSSITITDPDVAPEDLVTFSLSVLNGSLSASSTVSVSIAQTISSTVKLTGTASDVSTYLDTSTNVSYLSAKDESGINKDIISYSINDNAGSSDIGVVSTTQVDITNTNDAPLAVSQTYQGNLGNGVTTSGTVSGTDIDPSESLSFTVVSNPSYGSVIMNANGDFTYTHDGTAIASDFFTFKVNDGEVDSALTATATLSFNQSPVLQDQSFTVLENESVSITPVYTDNENDPISSYIIVSQPTYGTVVSLSDGYQYNHDGTNGINTDTFTIRVNDGYTDSGVATITMNITPVNDPPIAPTVNLTINEGESAVIDLTATDEENATLTYISVSNPNNGEATLNESSVSYSHDGSQSESDVIIYSVSDGVNTVTGTINIAIVLVNNPPVVPSQTVYVHENESVSFNLNAFDEEGDAIDSYTLESQTSLGSITVDSNGNASFVHTRGLINESIPDNDYSFVYPDSFTYQVSSLGQTSNIGTVTVLVIPFDHDQDGVPTKTEDLNNNGNFMDDDTDNDGTPNFLDIDDDEDTIPTLFENFFASVYNGDSDNDGILNYLDEDDDNDGILTKFETPFNPFFSPNKPSSVVRHKKKWDYNPKRWTLSKQYASKGLTKKEEEVEYPDTDGDGIPDFADVDDDGDGVLTVYEIPDQNGDGSPNDALDSDQESVPNYLDIDDDDDGVLTKEEFADQNGDGVPDDALDSDNEQVPNYLDVDDDNDGILTFFENPDKNGDGIPNDAQDSDGEQIPD